MSVTTTAPVVQQGPSGPEGSAPIQPDQLLLAEPTLSNEHAAKIATNGLISRIKEARAKGKELSLLDKTARQANAIIGEKYNSDGTLKSEATTTEVDGNTDQENTNSKKQNRQAKKDLRAEKRAEKKSAKANQPEYIDPDTGMVLLPTEKSKKDVKSNDTEVLPTVDKAALTLELEALEAELLAGNVGSTIATGRQLTEEQLNQRLLQPDYTGQKTYKKSDSKRMYALDEDNHKVRVSAEDYNAKVDRYLALKEQLNSDTTKEPGRIRRLKAAGYGLLGRERGDREKLSRGQKVAMGALGLAGAGVAIYALAKGLHVGSPKGHSADVVANRPGGIAGEAARGGHATSSAASTAGEAARGGNTAGNVAQTAGDSVKLPTQNTSNLVTFTVDKKWQPGSPTAWSWAHEQGVPNKNIPKFLESVMGKNWREAARGMHIGDKISATKEQIDQFKG